MSFDFNITVTSKGALIFYGLSHWSCTLHFSLSLAVNVEPKAMKVWVWDLNDWDLS